MTTADSVDKTEQKKLPAFMQIKRQRIVDSREPEELRMKLIETGWEQSKLAYGDFLMHTCEMKRVGITRKTVPDLLGSIGKVFERQLEEMLEYYDICVFLQEGSFQVLRTTGNIILPSRGIEYQTIQGIRNWRHRWLAKGFVFEPTSGSDDTVKRLNELYALYQKPMSLSARCKGYVDDRVLAMPSGVRGKSGLEILKSRSIADLCGMSVAQLMECEGIGQKRAENIFAHLHKRIVSQDIDQETGEIISSTEIEKET
jgi:ERCC4-type nuclease